MFVLAHQSFFYFFGNSRVHTQVFVIGYAGAVNLIRAETILLDGIFVGKTFGTGQLIHTAIGTWIHYIMLYVDGFSVFCTDKSHGMVAVLEIGCFFFLILFYQFGTGYSFGVHGYQCLHAVTAVNVEQLAGRT